MEIWIIALESGSKWIQTDLIEMIAYILIWIAFSVEINAYHHVGRSGCGHGGGCTVLALKPDAEKFRKTISPSEITNLFGSKQTKKITGDNEDEEGDSIYNDEDDEDEEEEDDDVDNTIEINQVQLNFDGAMDIPLKQSGNVLMDATTQVEEPQQKETDEDVSFTDEDRAYMDLNTVLDRVKTRQVNDAISMSEIPGSLKSDEVRTFKYDPAAGQVVDPMLYGAYRRWKEPQDAIRKKKMAKAKKTKKSFSTDNFYNAIKNLGPKSADAPSKTGVAEPPENMKPVQPKKPLPKKNRKKTVTPDDIRNLFSRKGEESSSKREEEQQGGGMTWNPMDQLNKQRRGKASRDLDREDEDEDEDEESALEAEDEAGGSGTASQQLQGKSKKATEFFNPLLSKEEMPKWLSDAEEEMKRKKLAKRRQKKLTDDWRFWAAIIAGTGFVTAFISIYQQTGGFGFGGGETGSSGNELVI